MLPFRFYRSRQCFVHLNYCYTYNNKHSCCKSRKETRFNIFCWKKNILSIFYEISKYYGKRAYWIDRR